MDMNQSTGKSQNAHRAINVRLNTQSMENHHDLLRKDLARYSMDLSTVSLGMIRERERSEEANDRLNETISEIPEKVRAISRNFETQLSTSLNEKSKAIAQRCEEIKAQNAQQRLFNATLENSIGESTLYWRKVQERSEAMLQEAKEIRSTSWRMMILASVLSLILGGLLGFLIQNLINK